MRVMEYYPIRLDEIREKVARKNGRNGSGTLASQERLWQGLQRYSNVKSQTNEFGEEIVRVDGDIPPSLPVENGQHFLFISYDQSAFTHGLHKYPAKFFPELPRWLVLRYSSEEDWVVDPFAGSGTTNVEALLHRRHSVGIDVDPFSRYLSKVKTTPLDARALLGTMETLLGQLVDFRPEFVSEKDIPEFPYRDNWFNREIVLELAYIRRSIDQLDAGPCIKDFYRICFSSIVRAVSNADDNCTRTVIRKKLNKVVCPSDALTRFAEAILKSVPRMTAFSAVCPSDVRVEFPVDSDARGITYPDGFFDLAVTSPPYCNAVDYPRTHQLEIYWLGFASGSLTPLKKKHVGTESVSAKDYRKVHRVGVDEADRVIERIYAGDPRRAYIAAEYLMDMRKNLCEVYRTLRRGGRYVVVLGNNRIRGQLFENWRYVMRMAEQVGFEVESHFASEIIRHFIKVPREERIDTDWVLVLGK